MKAALSKTLLALGVAAVLAGSASAQTNLLKAQIPFDFSVGDNRFEAGDYVFHLTGGELLAVQRVNGNAAATVLTNAIRARAKETSNAQLIFNRYGDTYFLSSAFWPGYENGRELIKSKAEAHLLARNAKPKTLKLNTEASVRR